MIPNWHSTCNFTCWLIACDFKNDSAIRVWELHSNSELCIIVFLDQMLCHHYILQFVEFGGRCELSFRINVLHKLYIEI